MRIVHYAQFGPRSCGLYETVKDLIVVERKLGVDALLVDVDGATGETGRVGLVDGDVVTSEPEVAWDADVLVRHTAIPARWQNIGVPIVMALHGRPESSYRISTGGENDIIQGIANKARDARYKAFVYFWPQFELPWRSIVGEKLRYVPAPVDLTYYGQGKDLGLSGSRRILIADIWRDDVIPLDSLFGAARYVERYNPAARIHIVGMPDRGKELAAAQPFLNGLRHCIGSASGIRREIRDWYRSCDVLVTPHTIATRVIRESLAAGLPVVASPGCECANETADPRCHEEIAAAIQNCLIDRDARRKARAMAEACFDATISGRAMIEVCREVMVSPKGRKVFVDVGAHLGETVRRFYRERPDADEFEIYCFEPDPQTFAKLLANVGAIQNVHCLNAALAAKPGAMRLQRGRVNEGEGSTLVDGKLTGDLGDVVEVRCLAAGDWFASLGNVETLVVKMNVEGAEYEILPALVDSGAMGRIHELYVQLHSLKFPTVQRIEMDRTELQWRAEMERFATKLFVTTKGMASFGRVA